MVRNYVKVGPKGSHDFAVTINGIDCDKRVIGEWFLNDGIFSDVCVAEEKYSPGLDCVTGGLGDCDGGVHQHIYLKSIELMKLDEVRDIIITLVDDIGFDLQVCKSRKSWLIYITKEDYCPFLKNVRVSELSLYARSKYHIITKYQKPGEIDRADHFLFNVGNFRNVVIDLAENHMQNLREEIQNNRVTYEPNMKCWLVRDMLKKFLRGDHMYVFGMPGLGKTEFVDRCISGKKVFRVGANDRFMFGTLDESYDIILFEDFQPFEHQKFLSTTLSIMDKKPVSISRKCKDDTKKMFNCQVIFVSNESIPSCMSMLERRVSFFCVDHKLYDCVSCLYLEINSM